MSVINRIDQKFNELKEKNKKALIVFITSGDPDLNSTYEFALQLEESGADIIELGVPFSDPVAEGPVIQAASERALKEGVKIDSIFDMVKKLRKKTDIPLLFMMYVNCIYVYGAERFFSNCRDAGIDGVIIPDLPFEEQGEISDTADKYGIHSILLIAPTSEERIKKIASNARGFLYCVSSSGVTGTRNSFNTDFEYFSGEINKHTASPTAVGFGISGPEQARMLSKYFDGVIMGSAFVKIIEKYGTESKEHIGKLAKEVRQALSNA